jgi:phage terminase large subunit-like protein
MAQILATLPQEVVRQIPADWLKLSPTELVTKLTAHIQTQEKKNRLINFKPFPKQMEFYRHGLTHRERLFRAINQVGKTMGAAVETVYHLTGNYPNWWPGIRFVNATRGWVMSESMQFSRDAAQKLLLGESPEEWGTGLLPAASIKKIVRASHSVQDAVDTLRVKHISGGVSTLVFKSAEVEQNKLGGDTLHFAWMDEEPPYGHYEEVYTRTNVHKGPVYTTFTPLKGATQLVVELIDKAKLAGSSVADIRWTIDDESIYSDADKEAMKLKYANSSDKDARLYAEPTRGSGSVFQSINEDSIKYRHIDIPDHWYRICGMDFGIKDPTCLVYIAHDRDNDVYYLYDAYGQTDKPAAVHYEAWKSRGEHIPVAWPADGLQRGKADGIQLKRVYEGLGMYMLSDPAMLPETNARGENNRSRTSVEASLGDLIELMQQGRFKVAAHLEPWWREFKAYFRKKDGKLNDADNHFIDATRYALMMEMQGAGVQGGRYEKLRYTRNSSFRSRYA